MIQCARNYRKILGIIFLPPLAVLSVIIGIMTGVCLRIYGIPVDWWWGIREVYIQWKYHPALHYQTMLTYRLVATGMNVNLNIPTQYWKLKYPKYPGIVGLIGLQTIIDLVMVPFRLVSGSFKGVMVVWQVGYKYWRIWTDGGTHESEVHRTGN